ncbi:MAG: hypothetical protein WCY09_09890 [Candidatus Omnitrophota bacterium]
MVKVKFYLRDKKEVVMEMNSFEPEKFNFSASNELRCGSKTTALAPNSVLYFEASETD